MRPKRKIRYFVVLPKGYVYLNSKKIVKDADYNPVKYDFSYTVFNLRKGLKMLDAGPEGTKLERWYRHKGKTRVETYFQLEN